MHVSIFQSVLTTIDCPVQMQQLTQIPFRLAASLDRHILTCAMHDLFRPYQKLLTVGFFINQFLAQLGTCALLDANGLVEGL